MRVTETIRCWSCRGTGINHGDGSSCETCESTGWLEVQIVGVGR